MVRDCSGRAVKAAAGYKASGPGSIPAAPTSRDSLMTALGAGNKYPEAQGLGLGKSRFLSMVVVLERYIYIYIYIYIYTRPLVMTPRTKRYRAAQPRVHDQIKPSSSSKSESAKKKVAASTTRMQTSERVEIFFLRLLSHRTTVRRHEE
jgi:hypothetical protein